MAKKRLAAILLALFAFVSACAGPSSKSSVEIDSTTSTTLAVDFAKQYLDIEAPFLERSVSAAAAVQAAAGSRNIASFIEGLHEVGAINWEFATALLAQKWPDDLRPAIQNQAKMLGDLSQWERIATEADLTTMVDAMQYLGARVVRATQATRELLGLPPSGSQPDIQTA